MTTLLRDFRHALRVLVRSPGFSITAVLVLALAMGANTAIFSVIEAVLLRPLPYHDPHRLCVLWKTVPARNIEWDWTSYPTIRDWREQSQSSKTLPLFCVPKLRRSRFPAKPGRKKFRAQRCRKPFSSCWAFHLCSDAPSLISSRSVATTLLSSASASGSGGSRRIEPFWAIRSSSTTKASRSLA